MEDICGLCCCRLTSHHCSIREYFSCNESENMNKKIQRGHITTGSRLTLFLQASNAREMWMEFNSSIARDCIVVDPVFLHASNARDCLLMLE